jgi:hypothetical protein
MNGVAVYTNIKRKIAIKVNIEDISLNKGKMSSYLSREDASVLAEAEIKFNYLNFIKIFLQLDANSSFI